MALTEGVREKPTGCGTVAGDFIAEGPAHNVQIPIVGKVGDLDLGNVEVGELRCHLFCTRISRLYFSVFRSGAAKTMHGWAGDVGRV